MKTPLGAGSTTNKLLRLLNWNCRACYSVLLLSIQIFRIVDAQIKLSRLCFETMQWRFRNYVQQILEKVIDIVLKITLR